VTPSLAVMKLRYG